MDVRTDPRLERCTPKLREIIQMFAQSPKMLKTELLLDFAKRMPRLPEGVEVPLERVHECQTPFFVHAEVRDGRVALYFDAPKEAPTVRAFAGMLAEGLGGATPEEVLDTPEDFYVPMGLSEVVSPLRLRGLEAVLRRIKRQVLERTGRA
ncbi:SufE family protein [Marinithermus hydrothermalis]|uniref:Fe-S metabolism associated SufE n=1 Tax=Marinithermus hydrothermalis (strain DSM 14884 / JCM 11576 / T1) TaxID=869210 RepID=F2NPE4_MARHT|nr:SufE family protein [Marinithermus hydrothermalis]AEB12225.1 Fe-S metabolism associated SufE [Marinithermus hydrothermalis DSM 14884]